MNIKLLLLIILIICLSIYIFNTYEHFQESISGIGDVQVNNLFVGGSIDIVPSGLIVAWYGNITNVPDGWNICDGTKGTPNLTNKFVVGTGNGTGLLSRKLNDTGGAETHKLTINELPVHNHFYVSSISDSNVLTGISGGGVDFAPGMSNPTTLTNTGETGGDVEHNNMPPYYVLIFIQKQ